MSGKMEMLRTGTHILYLLSIEESCKILVATNASSGLIFSVRWRKKKCLSTCIRSSIPRTREAFSLSGVFKREQVREEQTRRKRESERGSELGFGSHFITHCVVRLSPCLDSAMPTAWRKASCRVLSIGCHSEKISGNIKWAILHNASLIFSGEIF